MYDQTCRSVKNETTSWDSFEFYLSWQKNICAVMSNLSPIIIANAFHEVTVVSSL